jgi:acyl transferase domain-containing protein/NAD(P)-dependent dehydrogenase (short-subunit alcohol dehydrogenase family)/ubiquinone/menaquinone biosynthesis C-methylase UbiE/acyl carrier protein
VTTVKSSNSMHGSDIAIIGMSCRFPGARDVDEFWLILRDGRECITFFTDEEILACGVDPALLNNPNYVRAGAVLPDIERFDASFFGFTPREAEIMDVQQRLFLECAWEAMESAGYDSETGSGSCGVFAGTGLNTYLLNNLCSNRNLLESVNSFGVMLANDKDFLPTRVSYKLNLKGPSINVQTACSTSLVAVHLACQSLLAGECDLALAGGVSVRVPQKTGYLYQEGMIFSPDGHCRAFDAEARGTVGGSGVGIVVLKRLEDAVAAGDCIHAVIKGSAINNDGSLKAGYTAPSVEGQQAVISEAIAMAGIEPETITYIEAHGTATSLGDPIEIAALTRAFRSRTAKTGFCAIGSLKTNVGHLDTAAGVAGLIKTVLALRHRQIPPSLHFARPNPEINFADSPFRVNTELTEWTNGSPCRAGVSSFGIGGTNAHLILEEAPPMEPSGESRPSQLIVLSAKTSTALDRTCANLARHLEQHPDIHPADVAYTLGTGRKRFRHRRALVSRTVEDATLSLRTPGPEHVDSQESQDRSVVFMFSGQGSQYVNMGSELYRSEPTFREQVDIASEILEPHLDLDLRQLLFPGDDLADAERSLSQTSVTQPALFVLEYALATLWLEWGVRPRAMIGHSLGEYVAACLAGVFSLEDALTLVAARGKMMQHLPRGAMLSIPLPEKTVEPLLGKELSLAALNGPSLCVASGTAEAVTELHNRLNEEGVECQRLNTSHAFHSDMMEPILASFTEAVRKVSLKSPRIPYVSNVTGTWITAEEAMEPAYWARHLRQTVRFTEGLQQLLNTTEQVLLEIGPGRTLKTLALQHVAREQAHLVFTSVRDRRDSQSDVAFILTALGGLWMAGVQVDWPGFYRHERRRRLSLPSYPFERERYWIEPSGQTAAARNGSEIQPAKVLSETQSDIANWFYIPSWVRSLPPVCAPEKMTESNWLLFLDECGLGAAMLKELDRRGVKVSAVKAGEQFARLSDGLYSLNPGLRSDYDALINELRALDQIPRFVVHLWNVTSERTTPLKLDEVERAQSLGFFSLLFLTQALGDHNLATPARIAVVSNHLHDVTGEEPLDPEKATVLGPVAVIPQEYPDLNCLSIDVVLPQSETGDERRLVDQLITELAAERSDSVIAYRRQHRWAQTFVPSRLDGKQSPDQKPRLREGGVYLIAGGTGGVGLALAEWLAKFVRQPRLALIGRSELPARDTWEECLSNPNGPKCKAPDAPSPEGIGLDLKDETDHLARVEQKLRHELVRSSPDGLESMLDELCAGYIQSYFQSAGIDIGAGRSYQKEELKRRLRILPKFEKFFEFFIRVLREDSIVRTENDSVVFINNPVSTRPAERVSREVETRFPDITPLNRLLAHCVQHYGKALSGDIESISVLYPEGELNPLADSEEYAKTYETRTLYINLLREIISKAIQKSPSRRLRILEVGTGNGQLTSVLVESLKSSSVEYYATDISKSFVMKLEKEAARRGINFMRFGVLDISRDGAEQGFERHSFDLILGLDVVHTTPRIETTLEHLRDLLAPNGLVCLLETVKPQRFTDMIFGLAEGWWYFEDDDLRTTSPLLSIHKWVEVLTKRGFRNVDAYPRDEEQRARTEFGLIVAQNDAVMVADRDRQQSGSGDTDAGNHLRDRLKRIMDLEELGAETMVLSADVSDSEQMGRALEKIRQRFGPIHGVIHSAGIPGGGMIQLKTRAGAESEFVPKIRGTLTLEALLKDEKLDFFAFCSSHTSATGGFGQVAYSAVNAFQDAFAYYQASRDGNGTFTVSIDWDRWRNVGMAVDAETAHKRIAKEELAGGMRRDQGMEAFGRILSSGAAPRIIVSTRDFNALVKQIPTPQSPALETRPSVFELHARPKLNQDYLPPESDSQQKIVAIWQDELGIEPIGIHDSFLELGGDSLIAIKLISRIRESLSIKLTVRDFYEKPTVASLSEWIETVRWAALGSNVNSGDTLARGEEEGGSF